MTKKKTVKATKQQVEGAEFQSSTTETLKTVSKPVVARKPGTPWEGDEVTDEKVAAMNLLAAILFKGQSPSNSLPEMLQNVKPQLEGKGYGNCLDKLVIPTT